ncbi:MAG: hypothetical protein CM1200mP41_31220 [Gammaproteobacteria bacterium]|nr:MAG: hypothetical protein CM1200mP41_31220 [Gammaproteobacteria bacterium]
MIDLKRWADFRKVEFNTEPTFYEGEVEEPNERDGAYMVVAAKEAGLDSLKLAHAISRALWAEERFPFTKEELVQIANTEGFDGDGYGKRQKTHQLCWPTKQTLKNRSNAVSLACHFISFGTNLIGVRTVLSF